MPNVTSDRPSIRCYVLTCIIVLCATAFVLLIPTTSHAICIERVIPSSFTYYYDVEMTEWAGRCTTTFLDGCQYDCVGDITNSYWVGHPITCEDCG